jgi:hypothetical protein
MTLVIGSFGGVWTFILSNITASWNQVGSVLNSTKNFGGSVNLNSNGDTLAVCTPCSIWIFSYRKIDQKWIQQVEIIADGSGWDPNRPLELSEDGKTLATLFKWVFYYDNATIAPTLLPTISPTIAPTLLPTTTPTISSNNCTEKIFFSKDCTLTFKFIILLAGVATFILIIVLVSILFYTCSSKTNSYQLISSEAMPLKSVADDVHPSSLLLL